MRLIDSSSAACHLSNSYQTGAPRLAVARR
jgi:hypothetical protein